MALDPLTLLVVNVANLLALASALVILMGRQLSPSASAARRSLVAQGLGWGALILATPWAGTWVDGVLSTLSMVCISASQWMFFQALEGWLGERRHRRWLLVLAVAMPVGYAIGFGHYAFRVAWSNLLIAAQTLILARATLQPRRPVGSGWRWVLLACTLTMAAFTIARGVMGGWFTELYPYFEAPHPINVAALLAANVTLVLANVAVLVAWRDEAEQQMHRMAVTDQLTGLFNRHGWIEQAHRVMSQASRHGHPLSLLSIDLDHFKRINDTAGHEAGDAALELFGQLVQQCQRGGDLAARIGGEEFCILLPFCTGEAAKAVDQRLRAELSAAAPRRLGHELAFSSGLAVWEPRDSLLSLMSRADSALYQAKREGRGRLVQAPPSREPAGQRDPAEERKAQA